MNRMTLGWMAVVLASCSMTSQSEPSADGSFSEVDDRFAALVLEDEAGGAERSEMRQSAKPSFANLEGAAPEPEEAEAPRDLADGVRADEPDDGGATRAWFPETFLWRPRIETGDDGVAEVDVTVPDRLTEWRVLGLAHTRGGRQAGDVHSFVSVKELYVDPVMPTLLYVGDRVELPVQAVNTTDTPRSAEVQVKADGALSGGGFQRVDLRPNGTLTRRVSLDATAAGTGFVSATLPGLDAVRRDVRVVPRGKPHTGAAGGSVSGSRSFTLKGPSGADPATQELAVTVYPGGFAVLQAELERLGAGGRSADPAYGFSVASHLDALALAAGTEVDPEAVRRLQQRSWQRVVREAGLNPDEDDLVHLLAGLRDAEGHALAVERRGLWAERLTELQRPDGTWAPMDRGTVQALTAQTAVTAWALPEGEDTDLARSRAEGALERLVMQVEDPYTAAVVLAAGAVSGTQAERLEGVVLDAIVERPDGSRTVAVPPRVMGPWGRPTASEMLAWTRMALADRDDLTWRDDLVAELMTGYGPQGFGAGRADVVALEAVVDALPTLPEPVDVVLLADDEEVARDRLDPAQPRRPVTLRTRPGAKDPSYTLRVEGPAAGLAWTADLRSWTDWPEQSSSQGIEATWKPGRLTAGRIGTVELVVSAPRGVRPLLRAGLPAGTWVDVDTLTANPAVDRAVLKDDHVEIELTSFETAEVVDIPVRVQPAFAGRFSTRPLEVRSAGRSDFLPPSTWVVGG